MESFGNDGNVNYLVCGDGLTGIYPPMSKLMKLYTLNICNLLHVNYTSIKLK